MGLYPDHGVEYHLVLKNGKHVTIIGTHATDDRLLISEYYKKHKASWFDDLFARCDLITEDIDILMTSSEKLTLDTFINLHGNNVQSHGWYDVMTIGSSL
jgi:hypothetical protein